MSEDPTPGVPARHPDPLPERRFGDEEVRAILARASWREGSGSGLPAPHDPTLDDLLAAAAEAGLDPGEVRRAAALVHLDAGGVGASILGASPRRRTRLMLDGVSMPVDRHAIARAVELAAGRPGVVEKDPKGRFVWRSRGAAGGMEVIVAPAGTGVEVRVAADRSAATAWIWFAGLAAWSALSAFTPLAALPMAAKLLGFLAAPVVAALPFRAVAGRRLRPRVERMALDVARAVEALAPPTAP